MEEVGGEKSVDVEERELTGSGLNSIRIDVFVAKRKDLACIETIHSNLTLR